VIEPEEIAERRSWRRFVGMATVDIGPLRRHRDFRLLFVGRAVSFMGSMITAVAVPFQVYEVTRSSLAVGIISGLEVIPILGLAFLGGALADAQDRRRMVQLTELALALVSCVLVANALLPLPKLAVLYAAAVTMAGLDALQTPSLSAMLPRLVEREELTAAGALSSLRTTMGMIVGPAVGGLLVATIGLAGTYGVDVISFVVSLIALSRMRAIPPPAGADRPSIGRVLEGLRYAWGRPELMGTYLVDMVAMFFGMPSSLYPAIAVRFGGAGVLGLLLAAPAAGSFVAVATSGWSSHVHRHGLAIVIAAASWGAAIVLFGLSPSLWLALLCLAIAGGADMLSGVFRQAIWNQTIPDSLRGRLAGIEMISYSSGPTLGNLEAGAVASIFSIRAAIVSGGILCVAGVGILALALPGFIRYTNRRQVIEAQP
jgi:MFS family permease